MTQWALQLFHCITPLHNGAGQGLGTIDRPIIREAATGYPFIQSSTLKGAYRDKAGTDNAVTAAFGSKDANKPNLGCVSFTDAMLVALPVRSLAGTFALCTSRLALARLHRWLEIAQVTAQGPKAFQAAIATLLEKAAGMDQTAVGPSAWDPNGATTQGPPWDQAIRINDIRINDKGPYCLEGLVLDPEPDGGARAAVAEVAWRLAKLLFGADPKAFWHGYFRSRLLLVPDLPFSDLVKRATPVEANIKILETGITQDGSLRYTEYLPAEAVLASLVSAGDPRVGGVTSKGVWTLFTNVATGPIQLGADESKGKGIATSTAVPLAATGGNNG